MGNSAKREGLHSLLFIQSIGNNNYLKSGDDFSEEVTKELIGVDTRSKTSFTTKMLIVLEMK